MRTFFVSYILSYGGTKISLKNLHYKLVTLEDYISPNQTMKEIEAEIFQGYDYNSKIISICPL